ncbi:hypothetical protein [Acetobacterium sp.]|uniref:hypothetical protein n=1 Tax=Acetobacterium sp. TaxID=1872094 RepID=UPI002F4011E9
MYAWTMKFEQDNFTTPTLVSKDKDYYPALKKKYNEIYAILVENKVPYDIQDTIRKTGNIVLEVIQRYYSGNVRGALNGLNVILKPLMQNPLVVSNLENSLALKGLKVFRNDIDEDDQCLFSEVDLFRSRLSDRINGFKPENMLHIGFDNRGTIATQRFSIPGLPCLYFGTSSYDCWIEMGKPPDNVFNVSHAKFDDTIRVFNTAVNVYDISEFNTLTEEEKDKYNINFDQAIQTLMSLWLLSISASFTIEETGRTFRSEYIISQLIMLVARDSKLDGVIYLTKQLKTQLRNDNWAKPVSVNVALFAHYKGESIMSEICKQIKISSSVNYGEYKQLNAATQQSGEHLFVDWFLPSNSELAGKLISYSQTQFYGFDKYLKKQKKDYCNVDEINKVGE